MLVDTLNVPIVFKRLWSHGRRIRIPWTLNGLTVDSFVMSIDFQVGKLQERNWHWHILENIFGIILLRHPGIKLPQAAVIQPPSPPPSSTASNTTTTIAESISTTSPASITTTTSESDDHDETQVTFAESPIKMEFDRDFPLLQSPTGTTFRDKVTGSPQERRASGLDMDQITNLEADKDEIEVKPAVWPVTLTHMMGCGKLAIGIALKCID